MPIYEFYCDPCNTIFNFFSKTIDTRKRPLCPQCKAQKLSRWMSTFAVTGRAGEGGDIDELPVDETKMAHAMQKIAGEAENIDEDDPRQAAQLMRKLSQMTGLELGDGMEEALSRMEQGEDPESVEAELGDLLENEDPFRPEARTRRPAGRRPAPRTDETLYDL